MPVFNQRQVSFKKLPVDFSELVDTVITIDEILYQKVNENASYLT